MKNLKIRAKLILGFAIVVMLTSFGSISGIVGMANMSASSNRLYTHETKPVISAFCTLENMELIRIQARDLALNAGNFEKIQSLESDMLATFEGFEKALSEYGATIQGQREEWEITENINSQYVNTFKPGMQDILEAAKAGADQDTLVSMLNRLVPAVQTITSGIGRCIELREQSVQATAASNKLFANSITIMISVIIAISFLAALFLAFVISGMIIRPLIRISDFLKKVQESGDMTLSKHEQETLQSDMELKDEIGTCVSACIGLIKRISDVNEKLSMLAKGDLTFRVELLSEKDSIGLAINNVTENLNEMFGDIQGASDQIASGTHQISQGAQELASGSSQQAVSIENFSASLIEIDRKIHSNAQKAVDAQETSNQAGAMLEASIRSMSEMLGAMKEIDESSKSITKVIKVIDEIAFQTNILALNAAVEAARAGQHGKGFAVVADEVRNLAAKSAEAARETAELIEGSSQKVKEGNQIVEKTNSSLEAVVAGAKEASVLLGEVAADSAEQAKAIQEVKQGIGQISSVVQENSSSAEESAAASQQMAAQAAMLNSIVTRFKLKSPEAHNVSGYSYPNKAFPKNEYGVMSGDEKYS